MASEILFMSNAGCQLQQSCFLESFGRLSTMQGVLVCFIVFLAPYCFSVFIDIWYSSFRLRALQLSA